ncbi:MAG: PadR family transcriptional regulator [Actinobacteria bacterium]|nr:PadR family transcriptional regulator [Actinomycetota bacterium]
MARQAQTSTAVLGVLSIGSLTGYEIRQAISTVLGHFWHESFGQIYPCLADLEADGLVHATPGERSGSNRYEITAAGRQRLRELLATTPSAAPPRNGVLLRVFFGQSLAPADLDALLDDVVSEATGRLATYAGIRAAIVGDPAYPEHGRYWEATIRAGELTAQSQLVWATETRGTLLPPATIPAP